MLPATRLSGRHTCPVTTSPAPHVVVRLYRRFARASGPPDGIAMGSTTVIAGYMAAARLGDQTAHGGVLVIGEPSVLIG